MFWVYGSLFAIAYLQRGPIFSSTLFYIVTNFAVWTSGWYGYTIEGLITCYIMAIPFYVNTLTSTTLFYIMFKKAVNEKDHIISTIDYYGQFSRLRRAA
jgi:hypothetical protein